jgi:hypothetical protein
MGYRKHCGCAHFLARVTADSTIPTRKLFAYMIVVYMHIFKPGRISWAWWTGVAKLPKSIFTINTHNHNRVVYTCINKRHIPGRVADGPNFGHYTA